MKDCAAAGRSGAYDDRMKKLSRLPLRRLPVLLVAVLLSACSVTFSPDGGALAAVSVTSTEALPTYPGAVELERRQDRDKITLRLATRDPSASVFDFYDRELRARGWRPEEHDRGRNEFEAEYERGGEEVRLKVQQKRDYVRVELRYKDRDD